MRRRFYIGLFLIVATLLVFGQVRNHDFTNWDDPLYVTENPHVQAGLSPKNLVWAFTTTHASNWHPLVWLSLMLDSELYGLNPGNRLHMEGMKCEQGGNKTAAPQGSGHSSEYEKKKQGIR